MIDRLAGLVLAAGAGTRMGLPKALVRDPRTGEFWLLRAIDALRSGGCDDVTVVLGADSDQAIRLLSEGKERVKVVVADDWAQGMGRSLIAGLWSLDPTKIDVAVVMLVDLPDVDATVVREVLSAIDLDPQSLARASYSDGPGHPVVLGRGHWTKVMDVAVGDQGARSYLDSAGAELIDCSHLATGIDQDRPAPLSSQNSK